MKSLKKSFGLLSLLIICFISFISAGAVVEVPQSNNDPVSIIEKVMSIITSEIFIGGAFLFFLLVVFVILAFFFIKWFLQFLKERKDIFLQLRKKRIKLASIHRRYPSTHWLKIKKNTPIRTVKSENGELIISSPIAYHRGDYISHEGNTMLSINLVGNNKFFVFPKTDLLIIPNKKSYKIEHKNKSKRKVITNLPDVKNIVKFNEGEILLFAEGISRTGLYYVPVLKDKNGKIIDLSMPVFESLKKVVLADYLYEQTDEFSKLAKKSMDINPNLRYAVKSSDNSGSVEVPSGEGS